MGVLSASRGAHEGPLDRDWGVLSARADDVLTFQGVQTPSGEQIRYSLGSANSFQLDRVRELNQRRMRALDDMSKEARKSGEREKKQL